MAAVLKNSAGMEVHVLRTGAAIQRLIVPDRNGVVEDVVLGFDDEAPYKDSSPYFGAVVGRVANRIANACFDLDGRTYKLQSNNGNNTLHGGKVGFDKRTWDVQSRDERHVKLQYVSKVREEGFPGEVRASVTYRLAASENRLTVELEATTSAPTPLNFAQHSYFNLRGHASGTILDHQLQINGDHMTPVNEALIPTGDITPVAGTPFDFTTPHKIGERIEQVSGGYDHNFVLFGLGPNAKDKVKDGMAFTKPKLAVTLTDPVSRRGMRVHTTAPGVQFYSGNFLDGKAGAGGAGKGGTDYQLYAGLCLETQAFPDSINQPTFPSVVLRPGGKYRHIVEYEFFSQ